MITQAGQIIFEFLLGLVSFASVAILFASIIGLVVWMVVKFAAND